MLMVDDNDVREMKLAWKNSRDSYKLAVEANARGKDSNNPRGVVPGRGKIENADVLG